ncbi:MAG: proline--tRNA ligase [Desulfovibrionales bacterium]
MRLTQLYVPTLKEVPAEAEVISHKLLLRAGMIRKLTSGIYTYLPMGLRVLNKVARIVREEMDRAGSQEIFMPMVQPADLWKETGRWDVYGKELLRLKDRSGRDYCLGPTHEEVVTDLIRGEVRSYRQLPVNLYQIQTKYRDEIRPRFGLMRGREFIMKDAYSFDRDEKGAETSYWTMFDAYSRTFERLGLKFRAVEADSGAIGGSFSHEFMVLAETGEDVIAVCSACAYAANLEKAEVVCTMKECVDMPGEIETVATPGAHTVEEVADLLKIPAGKILKTLIYAADGELVAALIRGDRELNEIKLKNHLGVQELRLATPAEVEQASKAPVGFAGPVGLDVTKIIADLELMGATDWVTGANQNDAHHLHVDLKRDVTLTGTADLRTVTRKDPCPKCAAPMELPRGIEVGHVFKLGTKYSASMNATYLDENGKEQLMIMGCYGIGVSRIVAACIEQNHDDNGILFPPPLAPFEVAVLALNAKDEEVMSKAEGLYQDLVAQGMEVLLDDREERPGFKFKDADLMGFPIQLVVGGKGLARGVIEAKDRRTGEKTELPAENFQTAFSEYRKRVHEGWKGK